MRASPERLLTFRGGEGWSQAGVHWGCFSLKREIEEREQGVCGGSCIFVEFEKPVRYPDIAAGPWTLQVRSPASHVC